MVLYLIYDSTAKTVTHPMVAHSLQIAQNALNELNPENLNDLHIHILTELNDLLDLFLLNIDENKTLPEFIINRSGLARTANGPTQTPQEAHDPAPNC